MTNLRHKCDGYIFNTGYGKGIENTTDAISRISDWSKEDPNRMNPVEDSKGIDDDSIEVNRVNMGIRSDIDWVQKEMKSLNKNDPVAVKNTILGSWQSTPRPIQLSVLTTMYGNGCYDLDNTTFSNAISQMEADRDLFFSSKFNASNGLDNYTDLQHQACKNDNLGHSNVMELGNTLEDRSNKQCYAFNISRSQNLSRGKGSPVRINLPKCRK